LTTVFVYIICTHIILTRFYPVQTFFVNKYLNKVAEPPRQFPGRNVGPRPTFF